MSLVMTIAAQRQATTQNVPQAAPMDTAVRTISEIANLSAVLSRTVERRTNRDGRRSPTAAVSVADQPFKRCGRDRDFFLLRFLTDRVGGASDVERRREPHGCRLWSDDVSVWPQYPYSGELYFRGEFCGLG